MLNLVQFCWKIAPTSLQHLRPCYIWLCINRAIPLPSSNSTTSSSKRVGSQLEYCPKHQPSMTAERLEHLILVAGVMGSSHAISGMISCLSIKINMHNKHIFFCVQRFICKTKRCISIRTINIVIMCKLFLN